MTDSNHDVARKILEQLSIRAEDLLSSRGPAPVPTFEEYIPRIIPTVSSGTLRTYRPYWQRIRTDWGLRRIEDPLL